MTTQPEALRLADLLDDVPFIGFVFAEQAGIEDPGLAQEAAAELRRLYALNAELVEALKSMVRCSQTMDVNICADASQLAHAAIAKAEAA